MPVSVRLAKLVCSDSLGNWAIWVGHSTWEEGEVCLVDLSTPAFIVVFSYGEGRTKPLWQTGTSQVKKVMGNFQLDRDSSFLLWIEVSFASCNRCNKGWKRRFLDAVRLTWGHSFQLAYTQELWIKWCLAFRKEACLFFWSCTHLMTRVYQKRSENEFQAQAKAVVRLNNASPANGKRCLRLKDHSGALKIKKGLLSFDPLKNRLLVSLLSAWLSISGANCTRRRALFCLFG